MFCGPLVMRRRSDATSSARALWSYLTSSGPKHLEHTYCAVSSYSVPHSRHARFVTAIGKPQFFVVVRVCDEEVGFLRHTSPGIGTFPPKRGLPGFHRASPSTPLDVYSYVVGNDRKRPPRRNPPACGAEPGVSRPILEGVVIPSVDEPFSRHAEASPPAS